MFTNTTKQKLAEGHTVVGCLLPLPEPTLAEMLASCGFDFVLLDGEHGLFGPREIADSARAIELRGATPLARVTANKEEIVLRFLDSGAHGVQVPSLSSYDAFEAAVRSTKYGPRGHRGLAGGRMSDFGTTVSIGDYTRIANEQTMVIGHVETAAAVEHIEDFLHVDGLDVIFLGPVDLSHSLGHPGDLNHPDVADAIDTVASAVLGSDKVLGVYAPTPDGARTWMERGARYILTSFDTFIVEGASRYLSHLKAAPSVET